MTDLRIELNLTPALDRYLAIKREFRELSIEIYDKLLLRNPADEFVLVRRASERVPLSDAFCQWGKRFGRSALKCVVDKGVSALIARGCYSVDETRYEAEYLDVSRIDDCAESGSFMAALKKLENDERIRECGRQDRTERWGHTWVGGTLGGGIKGALKGALNAELMNLGGRLASGAINKLSRMKSQSGNLDKSERLFTLFQMELVEAIRVAIFSNVNGYVRCLRENTNEEICDQWPLLDQRAASGILGNLAAGRVPDQIRHESICELVRLDPFSAAAYDWIYRNEKSMRKDVESVADHFGVKVEALEEARRERIEAEEKQAREQLEKKEEQRRAAQAANKAKRTAFGKVWPTATEAISARSDRQKFLDCIAELTASYSGQDGFAGRRLTDDKRIIAQAVFETLPDERIIWLLDTSAWYNAHYGLIITDKGLRWKNRNPRLSRLSCLSWYAFGLSEKQPTITPYDTLQLSEGAFVDMDVNISWKEEWLPVVISCWNYWREGTFAKIDEVITIAKTTPSPSEVDISADCQSASLEQIILSAITEVGGGLYCEPNIPEKKLINAKVAMSVPPGETVVALMDTTFFGSAKTGVVLTDWGVRWANDWTTDSVRKAMSWKELRGSKPFSGEDCKLKLAEDAVIGTAGGGMSAVDLAKVIESVTR